MRTFATIELIVLWAAWWAAYLVRAPKSQKRPSVTAAGPTRLGLLGEFAGILLVFWFRAPGAPRDGVSALAGAFILGVAADVLMWTAVASLGRQFRITAGLYSDHHLVRTGPYRLVRHPIYASLLMITLATGLLLTPWLWLVIGVAVFLAGTEIRVHAEERLLASRFGADFTEYRKRVPAYLPFIR